MPASIQPHPPSPFLRKTAAQAAGEATLLYLLLLGITALLKWTLLRSIFGDELSPALGFADSSLLHAAGIVLRLFAADASQLLFFSIVAILLGRLALRARLRWVLALPLAALLAVGALNWIAYRELGQPVSSEVLWLGGTWIAGNPKTLAVILGRPPVLALLAAIALGIALVSTLLIRAKSRPLPMGWMSASVTFCLLWIPAALYSTVRNFGAGSIVARPYWTTTFHALTSQSSESRYLGGPVSLEGLRREYARVALLAGQRSVAPFEVPATPVRYIVVIVLETAPARYYDIMGNPQFPAFAEMSRDGIVASQHYSTMPYTAEAIYSIVTGMYPIHRVYRVASRTASRSSLASTLGNRGFETTFVDAFEIDWSPGNRMGDMWRGLGFQKLATGLSPKARGVRSATPEARSFELVASAIDSARSRGKGAFVTLATALGHFPWTENASATPAESARAMGAAALAADSLTGRLLEKLARDGILSESLVIVTGDHGLRFREEFRSLGLEPPDMELTFKVPFILYAPGLRNPHRRISVPTSHIDIVPTILEATGVAGDSLLLHGASMFRDPPRRLLFSLATGLAPADYLIYGTHRYTINHMTGAVTKDHLLIRSTLGLGSDSARRLMAIGQQVIARSAGYQIGQLRKQ